MRFSVQLFMAFVLVFLSGFSHAASDSFEDVRAFLQSQSTIRVFISRAPNNGHQTAGIRTMRRFRELGFNGVFEIVFDGESAEKLELLIPGFDATRADSVQSIQSPLIGRAKTISLERSWKLTKNKIAFGFCAASDQSLKEELRKYLNVHTLLSMQPQGWYNRGRSYSGIVGFNRERSLADLVVLNTYNAPMAAEDANRISADELRNLRYRPEIKLSLNHLLSAGDSIDLLPMYSSFIRPDAPRFFENVVGALNLARANNPNRLKNPIIIPLMTDLGGLEGLIKKELERRNAAWVDVNDVDQVIAAIRGEGKPITVIDIGSLPPLTFETLFERATLPVMLEGKNLTNMMQDRGIPYVNVTGRTTEIDRFPMSPESRVIANEAFGIFEYQEVRIAKRDEQIEKLARFYNTITNPNSDLRKAFASAAADPESENEKVVQSLLATMEFMKDDPMPAPSFVRTFADQVFERVSSVQRTCSAYLEQVRGAKVQ